MKLVWLVLGALCVFNGAQAAAPAFTWQWSATNLALLNHGKIVWQAVFDPAQGKPYINPLATLAGTEITALRPADHLWHRGLWWSWKYINHANYWEEDKQTGLSAGRTDLTHSQVQANDNFSARVELELSYHLPDQPPVMREQRLLLFHPPTADGRYAIDWTTTFTAEQDALLDRTPPKRDKQGLITGGSYAGLGVRFPRTFTNTWTFLNSTGERGQREGSGHGASWLDFSGLLPDGQTAGVTVLDHPSNVRHPTPWYWNPTLPFFCAALLANEPLQLKAGDTLKLRYRILVHEGAPQPKWIEQQWQEFTQ